MGQEVMMEKDFPCPCGKGILRIQVVEHDVWASGRHEKWQMLCDACRGEYKETFMANSLVKREHADEIEERSKAIYARRRAVGERATERYLSKFKSYVKALESKTAMRDAIDYRSSIQTFRKEARSAPGLDHVIEAGLRERPAHALRQIGVEDAEITAELDAIIGEEKTLKKFEEEIPKFPIPTTDTRGMRP